MPHKRLTFPAPARSWVQHQGLWSDHAWTEDEVRSYLAVGGWFSRGLHSFSSRAAATQAYTSSEAPHV